MVLESHDCHPKHGYFPRFQIHRIARMGPQPWTADSGDSLSRKRAMIFIAGSSRSNATKPPPLTETTDSPKSVVRLNLLNITVLCIGRGFGRPGHP
jgi:hypothetical protein